MAKALTEEQCAQYRRAGFVAPVDALDPAAARQYRSRFEAYERTHGGWYELAKGQKLYLLQTWVAGLASHPRILDAVADVLGPDLLVWGTSLFVKDVGDASYVSWHQDSTYWGLSEPAVCTAWVALSTANRLSGAMKMLPGSHELDQLPHRDTLAAGNLLTRGQEIEMTVDEDRAALIELEPGQISLHHIRTVHASEPNRSTDRRIGVAIRYIAPHVRQIHAVRDSAWLVRGADPHGHFLHESPPVADMHPDAIAEHARIMALRQDILYDGVRGKPARAGAPRSS